MIRRVVLEDAGRHAGILRVVVDQVAQVLQRGVGCYGDRPGGRVVGVDERPAAGGGLGPVGRVVDLGDRVAGGESLGHRAGGRADLGPQAQVRLAGLCVGLDGRGVVSADGLAAGVDQGGDLVDRIARAGGEDHAGDVVLVAEVERVGRAAAAGGEPRRVRVGQAVEIQGGRLGRTDRGGRFGQPGVVHEAMALGELVDLHLVGTFGGSGRRRGRQDVRIEGDGVGLFKGRSAAERVDLALEGGKSRFEVGQGEVLRLPLGLLGFEPVQGHTVVRHGTGDEHVAVDAGEDPCESQDAHVVLPSPDTASVSGEYATASPPVIEAKRQNFRPRYAPKRIRRQIS